MDNPFSSDAFGAGGFGGGNDQFGAPAFGSDGCNNNESYPGMPAPIDWSAPGGAAADPMGASAFGGGGIDPFAAAAAVSTVHSLAHEHPEIVKASMDGFAAAAENPSEPPRSLDPFNAVAAASHGVQPAFAIEAQEHLSTVTTSKPAAMTANQSASGPTFSITVTDPVEQSGGMMSKAYMTYKVNIKTSLPQYQWTEFSQIHRYSDFEWLHEELKEIHANCVIPPLPSKQATGNRTAEFVARRQWGLQHFLQHCAGHPELRTSRSLQFFLESNNETMPEAKKAAKKAQESKPGIWRRSKMAWKSLDKKYVDPELEAQRAALTQLQSVVQQMVNYTGKLEPSTKQLAMNYTNVGLAFTQFSETQAAQVAKASRHAAEHYSRIGSLSSDFASAEAQAMHTVFEYQCGLIDACGEVHDNRKVCAMAAQSYQNSVDSAKADFCKYQDNSSKAAKAAKAQAQLAECEEKLRIHTESYQAFAAALPVELVRFDEMRQKETVASMLRAAQISHMYHEQMTMEWAKHLESLQKESDSTF